MSFIFAKDVADVLDAALQPMDAPKAEKAKSDVKLKTNGDCSAVRGHHRQCAEHCLTIST